ncbi:Isy1-like splicing family-domain-containing protein, partial [Mycena vulgaris]
TRADTRPRIASNCTSLRECERWRGELLREISRKVAKIQDAGLTDYELRELNDAINAQLREKRHWENQIVALGGVNYCRNVAMLDVDGKEVPGTKGYKYFGRAKDLPGVRELFQSRKNLDDGDNTARAYYAKFFSQAPVYFGDEDDLSLGVRDYERGREDAEWDAACERLHGFVALPEHIPVPRLDALSTQNADEAANALASYLALLPAPALPSRAEMEAVLLALQKRVLMDESFGGGDEQ